MKDEAIHNALNYTEGKSFSDGNMVVGVSKNYMAIAFNNTTHNKNNLLVLQKADAIALFATMFPAMKKQEWLVQ